MGWVTYRVWSGGFARGEAERRVGAFGRSGGFQGVSENRAGGDVCMFSLLSFLERRISKSAGRGREGCFWCWGGPLTPGESQHEGLEFGTLMKI